MTIRHCHDVRPLLMAYLDSELDATTTVLLSEHLSACPPCRQRLHAEQTLEQGLAAALTTGAGLESMPEQVSRSIDAALREAAGLQAGPASEVTAGSDRRLVLVSRASWLAAAALLLASFVIWFDDAGVRRDPSAELARDLVAAFHQAVDQPLQPGELGLLAVSRELSSARFAGLSLPEAGMALDHHPFQVLGARPTVVSGARGVNVSYDCCGAITSVLVLPVDGLPPGVADAVAEGQMFETVIDGVQLKAFVLNGLLIGVSSRHSVDLAEEIRS